MRQQPFPPLQELEQAQAFQARHLGITQADEAVMLQALGIQSRQALMQDIIPSSIRRLGAMDLPAPITEEQALSELRAIAGHNQVFKSHIGQGYYGTYTPGVILRNILENPAWYTAYTPYQAEISQGRMEALLNFQTMVCDLTAMPIANASMLDEATAAAEAMTLARRSVKAKGNTFIVSSDCHSQTIEVILTRAAPLNIEVKVTRSPQAWQDALAADDYFGAINQYPGSSGGLVDWQASADLIHSKQAAFVVATDLLAMTLLIPPGEMGADIVVGSSQRFGMPMGAGGPHAAFLACRDDYKRSMPGRLVGVSVDGHGQPALRLALQTREQHIRREKATSNICTAQVLPAVVASMYAVYHGPTGLKRIAQRVASYTAMLAAGLQSMGVTLVHTTAFDTLTVDCGSKQAALSVHAKALVNKINLRRCHAGQQSHIGISLDETTCRADLEQLWSLFGQDGTPRPSFEAFEAGLPPRIPEPLHRTSPYLTHPVFQRHHSETAMLRYIRALSDKDLALDRTMIALGSCTMKLNATSEMIPITWPEFANVHPFAPADQLRGYALLAEQLGAWLCQATGYAAVSLQPNSGSQGEYAGLLAIRAWHASRQQSQRNVCLIPSSAHGTNPASAQMAGLRVVVVACDALGNVDMTDLQAQCERHQDELAAIMITYPSTHGVFETSVKALCDMVHRYGGRVYVDGANMNALVGLAAPGEFGGDVSHLNLHKTFCIPHGGGGPGVGPVCVVQDLAPFLPGQGVGTISAAPLGNASVLPISWMYCRMMGADGLTTASETAILSANYISTRLQQAFPTLYSNRSAGDQPGRVAHECILDVRPIKERTGGANGISAEDIAKRLIDYGFHAPTLSFPVPGTLMVEPTESESLQELDRFINAMLAIREEIAKVEAGIWPVDDNPLKNAPHTAYSLMQAKWNHPYTREEAGFPAGVRPDTKYWAPVGRIDNVYGDRNLFCSCVPVTDLDPQPPSQGS